METMAKVFRFKKKLSAVMVDGNLWFVANEIADYLGMSRQYVVNTVKADEIFLLNGRHHVEKIKTVDNSVYRITLVNKSGIITIADSIRNEQKSEKAKELVEHINEILYANMKESWDKHIAKRDKGKERSDLLPFEPEQPGDLFDVQKEDRIKHLEDQMIQLTDALQIEKDNRHRMWHEIQALQDVVRSLSIQNTITTDQSGKRMIDIDAFVDMVKGSSADGNVR